MIVLNSVGELSPTMAHIYTGRLLSNATFPDGSRHSSAALGMFSVTHIMSVLVLLSVVGVGMQQYMI